MVALHLHPGCRSRKAVALLLSLFLVAIVMVLALSSLAASSTMIGIARNVRLEPCARATAETGLQLTFTEIKRNGDWRTDYPNGVWVSDEPFHNGTFTITVEDGEDIDLDGIVDGDGDLGDSAGERVTISSVGACQGVSHKLRVTVTPPNVLLMVLPDETSPTALHQARITLLEDWGYRVHLISASATQAEFDDAVANYHLVYVVGDVLDDFLGTKLSFAPIAVVAEVNNQDEVINELGLADKANLLDETELHIPNVDHFIIAPFAKDADLIISDVDQTLTRISNNAYSAGATVAAELAQTGDAALLVHEAGSQLFDTGLLPDATRAPARRVLLPWGGDSFDITRLTDDGQTLLARSLEWCWSGGPVAIFEDDTTPDATWSDDTKAEVMTAQRLIMPEDGTVTSLSLYIDGIPPKPVRFAIYTDLAGAPDQLIVQGEPFPTLVHHFEWIAGNLPVTYLDAGPYWLAFTYDDSAMDVKAKPNAGGQVCIKNQQVLIPGFPAVWGACDTTSDWDYAIFANYMSDSQLVVNQGGYSLRREQP